MRANLASHVYCSRDFILMIEVFVFDKWPSFDKLYHKGVIVRRRVASEGKKMVKKHMYGALKYTSEYYRMKRRTF